MHYAKTNELETYWTSHPCDDPECPGRMSKAERTKRKRELSAGKVLRAKQSDEANTPRYMHLTLEEAHLQYSPGFW